MATKSLDEFLSKHEVSPTKLKKIKDICKDNYVETVDDFLKLKKEQLKDLPFGITNAIEEIQKKSDGPVLETSTQAVGRKTNVEDVPEVAEETRRSMAHPFSDIPALETAAADPSPQQPKQGAAATKEDLPATSFLLSRQAAQSQDRIEPPDDGSMEHPAVLEVPLSKLGPELPAISTEAPDEELSERLPGEKTPPFRNRGSSAVTTPSGHGVIRSNTKRRKSTRDREWFKKISELPVYPPADEKPEKGRAKTPQMDSKELLEAPLEMDREGSRGSSLVPPRRTLNKQKTMELNASQVVVEERLRMETARVKILKGQYKGQKGWRERWWSAKNVWILRLDGTDKQIGAAEPQEKITVPIKDLFLDVDDTDTPLTERELVMSHGSSESLRACFLDDSDIASTLIYLILSYMVPSRDAPMQVRYRGQEWNAIATSLQTDPERLGVDTIYAANDELGSCDVLIESTDALFRVIEDETSSSSPSNDPKSAQGKIIIFAGLLCSEREVTNVDEQYVVNVLKSLKLSTKQMDDIKQEGRELMDKYEAMYPEGGEPTEQTMQYAANLKEFAETADNLVATAEGDRQKGPGSRPQRLLERLVAYCGLHQAGNGFTTVAEQDHIEETIRHYFIQKAFIEGNEDAKADAIQIELIFETLDFNKQRQLNYREFRQFRIWTQHFNFTEDEWQRLAATLNFEANSPEEGMEIDRFITWYGQDDDAKRNPHDHYKLIMEAYQKTQSVFIAMDGDRDGLLSFKEFQELSNETNDTNAANELNFKAFEQLTTIHKFEPKEGLDILGFKRVYLHSGGNILKDFQAVRSGAMDRSVTFPQNYSHEFIDELTQEALAEVQQTNPLFGDLPVKEAKSLAKILDKALKKRELTGKKLTGYHLNQIRRRQEYKNNPRDYCKGLGIDKSKDSIIKQITMLFAKRPTASQG